MSGNLNEWKALKLKIGLTINNIPLSVPEPNFLPFSELRTSDFRLFFSLPLSPILHRIYLRIQPFVYEFDIGNGVKRVGIVGTDNINHVW